MAAKGHTPKDRLREQMAFNTVNCAAPCFFRFDCSRILIFCETGELLSKHQNGFNDNIMISVIGTAIRL